MIEGFRFFPGALDTEAQRSVLAEILAASDRAPFYRPMTRGGPMSVEMTNLGPVGWLTGPSGYRYAPEHPITGDPWPAMPPVLLDLWRTHTGCEADPDACLVNRYRGNARMGLHQDRDEADFAHPVLSISLGDTAVFRLGGTSRKDPTRSMRLASGDICVLSGSARLAFHGIDRILEGSSRLVPGGGRINLTLRKARAI